MHGFEKYKTKFGKAFASRGNSRRQSLWILCHATNSDQRNIDQRQMEYLLTQDEERRGDRGSTNRSLPPWPRDFRRSACPRMGLHTAFCARPSAATPRWSIIWLEIARRQEDIRSLQLRQPLIYQRMGMALCGSARHAGIWALASSHRPPYCTKSEPFTNRDNDVDKRRQAKASDYRHRHLGCPLETSRAPTYQWQRPQFSSRHHQRLICGHNGEAWIGRTKLRKFRKVSTEYTNGVPWSSANTRWDTKTRKPRIPTHACPGVMPDRPVLPSCHIYGGRSCHATV